MIVEIHLFKINQMIIFQRPQQLCTAHVVWGLWSGHKQQIKGYFFSFYRNMTKIWFCFKSQQNIMRNCVPKIYSISCYSYVIISRTWLCSVGRVARNMGFTLHRACTGTKLLVKKSHRLWPTKRKVNAQIEVENLF